MRGFEQSDWLIWGHVDRLKIVVALILHVSIFWPFFFFFKIFFINNAELINYRLCGHMRCKIPLPML